MAKTDKNLSVDSGFFETKEDSPEVEFDPEDIIIPKIEKTTEEIKHVETHKDKWLYGKQILITIGISIAVILASRRYPKVNYVVSGITGCYICLAFVLSIFSYIIDYGSILTYISYCVLYICCKVRQPRVGQGAQNMSFSKPQKYVTPIRGARRV